MPDFTPRNPNYFDRTTASFARQSFMETLGASLKNICAGYCEIHLAYNKALTQQHEYFHGGVIGTLADNAGGYAAFTLMNATDSVLTVEYKLNIMAPAKRRTADRTRAGITRWPPHLGMSHRRLLRSERY